MKKQFLLGMASIMCAGMATTGTAFAATPGTAVPGNVPVSYDNRNNVTDPDNPGKPTWSVSIPPSITFTDTAKTQDVDVELNPMSGSKLTDFTNSFTVSVKLKSTNGLKLIADSEELSYAMAYGSTSVSGTTEASIATLTKASAKQAGTATLDAAAKPTKIATYTDTLTYTVQKTAD